MAEYSKILAHRPKCEFDGCEKEAKFDSFARCYGCWCYMCAEHYDAFGCKVKGMFTDLDELAERRHKRGLN